MEVNLNLTTKAFFFKKNVKNAYWDNNIAMIEIILWGWT